MEIRIFNNSNQMGVYDLSIRQIGFEPCSPSHYHGPAVRQHWLIHFVKRGKGLFRYADETVEISAGEMFLIYPHEVTFYQADSKSPWEYYWIGFSGSCAEDLLLAAGFSRDSRRVAFGLTASYAIDEVIKELTRKKIMSGSDKVYETSKIYEIFSWLLKNRESEGASGGSEGGRNPLLTAAVEYMKRSYMMELTVSDVAAHIGVDRTQLYRYFKDEYDISPQRYLINLRMKQAKNLAENTRLPVKQIAFSVGYQDQYLFSKMFKKAYGSSPRQYREATVSRAEII